MPWWPPRPPPGARPRRACRRATSSGAARQRRCRRGRPTAQSHLRFGYNDALDLSLPCSTSLLQPFCTAVPLSVPVSVFLFLFAEQPLTAFFCPAAPLQAHIDELQERCECLESGGPVDLVAQEDAEEARAAAADAAKSAERWRHQVGGDVSCDRVPGQLDRS